MRLTSLLRQFSLASSSSPGSSSSCSLYGQLLDCVTRDLHALPTSDMRALSKAIAEHYAEFPSMLAVSCDRQLAIASSSVSSASPPSSSSSPLSVPFAAALSLCQIVRKVTKAASQANASKNHAVWRAYDEFVRESLPSLQVRMLPVIERLLLMPPEEHEWTHAHFLMLFESYLTISAAVPPPPSPHHRKVPSSASLESLSVVDRILSLQARLARPFAPSSELATRFFLTCFRFTSAVGSPASLLAFRRYFWVDILPRMHEIGSLQTRIDLFTTISHSLQQGGGHTDSSNMMQLVESLVYNLKNYKQLEPVPPSSSPSPIAADEADDSDQPRAARYESQLQSTHALLQDQNALISELGAEQVKLRQSCVVASQTANATAPTSADAQLLRSKDAQIAALSSEIFGARARALASRLDVDRIRLQMARVQDRSAHAAEGHREATDALQARIAEMQEEMHVLQQENLTLVQSVADASAAAQEAAADALTEDDSQEEEEEDAEPASEEEEELTGPEPLTDPIVSGTPLSPLHAHQIVVLRQARYNLTLENRSLHSTVLSLETQLKEITWNVNLMRCKTAGEITADQQRRIEFLEAENDRLYLEIRKLRSQTKLALRIAASRSELEELQEDIHSLQEAREELIESIKELNGGELPAGLVHHQAAQSTPNDDETDDVDDAANEEDETEAEEAPTTTTENGTESDGISTADDDTEQPDSLVTELRSELAVRTEEVSLLKGELDSLRARALQSASQASLVPQLQSSLAERESRITALTTEKEKAEQESLSLRTRLIFTQEQVMDLEAALAARSSETKSAAAVTPASPSVESSLRAQIAELESTIEEGMAQVEDMQAEMTTQASKVKALEIELEVARAACTTDEPTRDEPRDDTAEMNDLQQRVASLTVALATKEANMAALYSASEKAMMQLRSQLEDAQAIIARNVADAETKTNSAVADGELAADISANLMAEIDALRSECEQLRANNSRASASETALHDGASVTHAASLAQLQAELLTAQSAASSSTASLEEVRSQLHRAEAEHATTMAALSMELDEAVSARDDALKSAQADRAACEAAHAAEFQLKADLASAQAAHAQTADVSAAQITHAADSDRVASLEKEIASLRAQSTSRTAVDLTQVEADLATSREDASSMRDRLDALESELASEQYQSKSNEKKWKKEKEKLVAEAAEAARALAAAQATAATPSVAPVTPPPVVSSPPTSTFDQLSASERFSERFAHARVTSLVAGKKKKAVVHEQAEK